MSFSMRIRSLTVLALPMLFAACADQVSSPIASRSMAATSRDVSASKGSNSLATWHSNTEKYRDAGKKPGTGRSGTAGIQVRALQYRSGAVTVDVTTGSFDVADSVGGYLSKVQAKVFTGDKKNSTKNYNVNDVPTFSFNPGALSRGSIVAIQANVRGKDGKRTDVVNAVDTVGLAPDLAVAKVLAPTQVVQGEVFTVSALVAEMNGQTGGRANCVLYVDGVKVDATNNVWVDAAGEVSCAFATRITTGGVHTAKVALEGSSPADFDASNNAKSVSIQIATPMLYNATAFEHAGSYTNNYTYQYDDFPSAGAYHSTYHLDYSEQTRTQSTHVYTWVEQPIAFPVTNVTLGTTTDGVSLDSKSFSNIASSGKFGTATDGGQCGSNQDNGVSMVVCTYNRGTALWSTVTYDRYAGDVTYVSSQYATYAAPWGSGMYFANTTAQGNLIPSVNAADWGSAYLTPFGSQLTFNIALKSGNFLYTANPSITLTPTPYSTSNPFCLGPTTNDTNTGSFSECYDIHGSYLDKEGFVYAPGV